ELYEGALESSPASPRFPGSEEWWSRLDAERQAPLDRWPPPALAEAARAEPRREVADRRGASGVATVAALASSGAPVLVLCGGALEGAGRNPRSPEVAGRRLRVLEDLGALRWETSPAARSVRVVSSEETDLERVSCFVAYRARSEEGERFLSGRRQPS